MSALQQIQQLEAQVAQSIVGQKQVIESLILGLLCNGNLLLEGYPGTAKTRSIRALAKAMEITFGRVQFTPDLLPSDVTGTEVYSEVDGEAPEGYIVVRSNSYQHIICMRLGGLAKELGRYLAFCRRCALSSFKADAASVRYCLRHLAGGCRRPYGRHAG